MNKITEILKTNKYVIIWTAAYIAIVWAILLFMFNFNIFVGHDWHLLTHAEIKGFAGFVFGILMLAALPMYIATTAVIVRTQKPLITINIAPVIKIFAAIIPHPVPAQQTAPSIRTNTAPQIAPAPATPKTTDTKNTKPAPDTDFPNTMPPELRGAFIRARQNVNMFATSNFNRPTTANTAQPIPTQDTPQTSDSGDMPLPTDFDFDSDTDSDFAPSVAMPTFTDINFGDDNNDDTDKKSDATDGDDTPAPTGDDSVMDYLAAHGHTPRRDGNLIIVNDIVIATHNDPDFWIADPDNWFAAGKQIASPIAQLTQAASENNRHPVLYLAQTNIDDLDAHRTEWTEMGITIITNLDELPL